MDHALTSEIDDLTDDALTARVRVFQRRRGHRYSFDDVVTAWVAARAAPEAQRYLDLGCGLGSVLLMVADRLAPRCAVGIEAQTESFALARRNVDRSWLRERVSVLHGDLRDDSTLARAHELEPVFDLITGTPPYKLPGTATPSPDPQRAHARIELRGGVEDYLATAGKMLAPGGTCVVCMESAGASRVAAGAYAAGLEICERLDVIPIASGKGRLFSVFTLQHAPRSLAGGAVFRDTRTVPRAVIGESAPASQRTESLESRNHASSQAAGFRVLQLVLRDASGARTPAALELRRFFGLEDPEGEPVSPPRLRPGVRHAERDVADAQHSERAP